MPRWVFIRPCNISPYYDPEIQEPLGLEYLSACRRAQGDPVLLLDSALESLEDKKLARRAISFQPDIIGVSLTTAQEIDSIAAIYQEAVRVLSGRRVMWVAGGNFITTEPGWAHRLLPDAFILVRFEGEKILDELVEIWESEGTQPESHDAAEKTRKVMVGQPVEDLNHQCFPDRPFAAQILANEWAFNIQGSRGCCGACRYCAASGMSRTMTNQWRGRSPGNIVDEMSGIHHQFGIHSFNFIDEDFLGPVHQSRERALAFAEEIRKRNLCVSFGIQARPDSLNESIIDQLAEAGLRYVFTGIESDDPRDFKRWGRSWIPDPWKLIRQLRKRDVEVNAGVIMFHPHTTLKGLRRFAETLHQHYLLDYQAIVNRLAAMPGSVMYEEAMRDGLIDPDIPGQQDLPFLDPEMEDLYADLFHALAPLGPPSMHALCSLPPLTTQGVVTNRLPENYHKLKEIIQVLNEAAAKTFFDLLDVTEKGRDRKGMISEFRSINLKIAFQAARALANGNFASSLEDLEKAVLKDSGM